MYRRLPSGMLLDVLVMSKYTATVVLGSTPPRPQVLVPPLPTCMSDTLLLLLAACRPGLCKGVTGPIAPDNLNSLDVKTCNVP
jgi:hypothetical protein